MLEHGAGHADRARLGKLLETRSDVHAIAEHVAVLMDDVAKVDTNAEQDPTVGRMLPLPLGHGGLQINRGTDRGHGAVEFDDQAIPGRLDDVPAVTPDLGSINSRRMALSRAKVPASSAPMSREYPATSAQMIAARRRFGTGSCMGAPS